MSREIKRVPVDFDWPLNKTWHGYLMPDSLHEATCDDCAGDGGTASRQWVSQIVALLLLLDDDRNQQQRGRPMHPYLTDTGSRVRAGRPGEDIAAFGTGLAGRAASFLGHDAIDNWRALEKVIRVAGLDPSTWGICPTCEGHGSVERYPGQRAEAEAWQQTEPPAGDGWQLWETVSEGSPISPVFADADGLVDWLCSPAYTGGSSSPMGRAQAERFVRAGWAPSAAATAAGVVPGEQWV